MAQLAHTAKVGDTNQRDRMIARQLKKIGLIEGKAGQYRPVENLDNRDLTAIVEYLNNRHESAQNCGLVDSKQLEACILLNENLQDAKSSEAQILARFR